MANQTLHLDEKLYSYFGNVAYREPQILGQLRERTAKVTGAEMQIGPEQGALMAMLVKMSGARKILEIGTFTGYSSLAMALALPSDGRLIASDVSEEWTGIAREFWQKAGVASRISLLLKPGSETIGGLIAAGEASSFDLVFIDADKANYDRYYEGGLVLLRQGGTLMIDNVLWGGDVADPAKNDADTSALRALNAKIKADNRVDHCMIPIGDGLTLARKR
jgi:predicted O-methyltransferase YrrM